jgi:5-methylcytosine-specific restriction endonuclease McrA
VTVKRACPRCGTLVVRKGVCSTCAPVFARERRERHAKRMARAAEQRPEYGKLMTSKAWRRARAAARERDGGCIIRSGCAGRLEAHHVVPVNEGGEPVDLDNLVTLCSRHHRLVEAGTLRLHPPHR